MNDVSIGEARTLAHADMLVAVTGQACDQHATGLRGYRGPVLLNTCGQVGRTKGKHINWQGNIR